VTEWSWPNQQVVRADESGPGIDTPPLIEAGEARWMLAGSDMAPPTTHGRVTFATGDQANPGTIWITLVDLEGADQTERALRLTIGSVIHLENDSGSWQEYVCRETPTLDGTLLTLVDPIHWNTNGLLVDGEEIALTGHPPEINPL